MAKLTPSRFRVLEEAVRHRDGVFSNTVVGGFQKAARRRLIDGMVADGLLEPSPYGDWYVTDAGRKVHADVTSRSEASGTA